MPAIIVVVLMMIMLLTWSACFTVGR